MHSLAQCFLFLARRKTQSMPEHRRVFSTKSKNKKDKPRVYIYLFNNPDILKPKLYQKMMQKIKTTILTLLASAAVLTILGAFVMTETTTQEVANCSCLKVAKKTGDNWRVINKGTIIRGFRQEVRNVAVKDVKLIDDGTMSYLQMTSVNDRCYKAFFTFDPCGRENPAIYKVVNQGGWPPAPERECK